MTLHPDKRYAQVADEPFHISKACIEPASVKKSVTSVYLENDTEEFLLCNLDSGCLNVDLDLNFNKGEKICVRAEGGGIIHLTGYLMEGPDYDMDDFDEDSSDEEEEEASSDEDVDDVKSKPAATNGVNKKISPLDKLLAEKKKKSEAPKKLEDVSAEIKKAEAMKKKLGGGDVSKKGALPVAADDDDSSDEEDDSSDDDNMLDLEAEEGEEEEEEDSDEEGEEEEEDSSDDDGETDDEVEEPPAKKKVTETPKDTKKLNGSQVANKDSKKDAKKASPAKKEPAAAAQATPAKKEGAAAAAAQATPESKKKKEKKSQEKTPAKDPEAAKTPKADGAKQPKDSATPGKTPKRTLKGGLVVEDLKVGNGPEAKAGSMAAVYYVGRLKSNNKQFDACREGKPFKFRVGTGEVIKGWDIGVAGMKVGGKRILTCPPQLGYGGKGAAPTIPPNATLVFEVELKSVS